jgi:hypothetical protein
MVGHLLSRKPNCDKPFEVAIGTQDSHEILVHVVSNHLVWTELSTSTASFEAG